MPGTRRVLLHSAGSCASFEPVEELDALRMPPA
jgi:hypothetical protein